MICWVCNDWAFLENGDLCLNCQEFLNFEENQKGGI